MQWAQKRTRHKAMQSAASRDPLLDSALFKAGVSLGDRISIDSIGPYKIIAIEF